MITNGNPSHHHQIEFRGIRGGEDQRGLGWSGDIALDSIFINTGRCEGDPTVPTPPPPGGTSKYIPFHKSSSHCVSHESIFY